MGISRSDMYLMLVNVEFAHSALCCYQDTGQHYLCIACVLSADSALMTSAERHTKSVVQLCLFVHV